MRLEIVWHSEPIEFESGDCLYHCRGCGPFEPTGGAPGILGSDRYEVMLHGILVYIIQSRQIRRLMRETSIPEIVPHLPAGRVVQFIYPFCGFDVQHTEHRTETCCI